VALSDAVRRARQGDEAAFETLYREHAGRVYAVCLRLTADPIRARELVQDVFVRCWEKLDSFRGESAFGTWLHRLAVNEVLMRFRAERRRAEDPLSEEGAAEPTAAVAPTGLKMDLEAAIASLPPGARQVLVLHDLEGYAHAEIGQMMGIAEGTSKAHLFRARRLLRERLDR
jgi:RNA polymerase sigma-70 factor (ECF subfamily)